MGAADAGLRPGAGTGVGRHRRRAADLGADQRGARTGAHRPGHPGRHPLPGLRRLPGRRRRHGRQGLQRRPRRAAAVRDDLPPLQCGHRPLPAGRHGHLARDLDRLRRHRRQPARRRRPQPAAGRDGPRDPVRQPLRAAHRRPHRPPAGAREHTGGAGTDVPAPPRAVARTAAVSRSACAALSC
ncbi:hypothetical protein SBRY_10711 [Actinacidiphila bryophytorum]|uniref:Uncharacterized protein n=1 Tax=Actinacidiphila bryophytorum TaxID=1436133 RepID=A0A9W4GX30_9ACTN|nr:hypothetical protein SBRY_10711 [Actinacidiphila bryophytorum]